MSCLTNLLKLLLTINPNFRDIKRDIHRYIPKSQPVSVLISLLVIHHTSKIPLAFQMQEILVTKAGELLIIALCCLKLHGTPVTENWYDSINYPLLFLAPLLFFLSQISRH